MIKSKKILIIAIGYIIFLFCISFFIFSKEVFLKYPQLASQILNNNFLPQNCFSSSPLYIYINAFFIYILGFTPLQLKFLQLIILGFFSIILYKTLILYFNKNLALLILCVVILYSPVIIYAFSLVPEIFILFFNILFFYFLSKKRYLESGFSLGCSLILRPSIIIFAIFVILYLWRQKILKKYLWKWIISFLFPALVVSVINYKTDKDLVPVTWSGGSVFYSSNNPYSKGLGYTPPPLLTYLENEYYLKKGSFPYEHQLFKQIACCLSEKRLKDSQVSRFWYSEALKFIRKEPFHFIKLLFKKLFYFLNTYELYDTFPSYLNSLLLKEKIRILLHLNIIYPLSMIGIISYLKLRKTHRELLLDLLILYLLSYLMVSMIFYVSSRLRMPIIIGLGVFAGVGIKKIINSVIKKDCKKIFIYTLIFVFTSIIVNIEDEVISYDKKINKPSFLLYNLGITHLKKGNLSQAIKYLQKAYIISPQDIILKQLLQRLSPQSLKNISPKVDYSKKGNLILKQKLINKGLKYFYDNRLSKAEKIFDILHIYFPQDKFILYNLGLVYLKESKLIEGIKTLEEIKEDLKFSTFSFEMFYFLGEAWYKLGDFKKASSYLKKSLCLNPFFKASEELLKKIKKIKSRAPTYSPTPSREQYHRPWRA